MSEDDVLIEVRAAREAYAARHQFDIRAMIADLRSRDQTHDWPVVRHAPRRPQPTISPVAVLEEMIEPSGIP